MANRRRNSSASRLSHNDTSAPGGSSDRHPVYHGICLRDGKWEPEIHEPHKNTRLYLGTYPTPEMAAAAYDVAALALKGTNAVLNFPDSNISNMLPECPTAEDILIAAARAAAARSPPPGYAHGGGSMTAGGTDTAPPGVVMDDEEVFNMPNLLSDMAQGMLLSPPRFDYNPPENGSYYNSGGSGNLWDY